MVNAAVCKTANQEFESLRVLYQSGREAECAGLQTPYDRHGHIAGSNPAFDVGNVADRLNAHHWKWCGLTPTRVRTSPFPLGELPEFG